MEQVILEVMGVEVPGSVTTVDRIDFSNDTATASLRGPLTNARYGLKSVGNQNYGYFLEDFQTVIVLITLMIPQRHRQEDLFLEVRITQV